MTPSDDGFEKAEWRINRQYFSTIENQNKDIEMKKSFFSPNRKIESSHQELTVERMVPEKSQFLVAVDDNMQAFETGCIELLSVWPVGGGGR